ncbi:MAG: hypothetical protein ACUVWY_01670 [Desulfosoma sp.]|uniref:hypothetical protein n=1 Tax=Desulfosoma sp. TaxID=2603217 RepID=UPI004048F0EF
MKTQRLGIVHKAAEPMGNGRRCGKAGLGGQGRLAARFFSIKCRGWILAAVFLMWQAVTASAASGPLAAEAAKEQYGPRIAVENPVADAGDVMENGAISHDFVVRNTGSAPLTIEQVLPG